MKNGMKIWYSPRTPDKFDVGMESLGEAENIERNSI